MDFGKTKFNKSIDISLSDQNTIESKYLKYKLRNYVDLKGEISGLDMVMNLFFHIVYSMIWKRSCGGNPTHDSTQKINGGPIYGMDKKQKKLGELPAQEYDT